jgi:hypothetical protein
MVSQRCWKRGSRGDEPNLDAPARCVGITFTHRLASQFLSSGDSGCAAEVRLKIDSVVHYTDTAHQDLACRDVGADSLAGADNGRGIEGAPCA